jgi:CBS domain containing-hemolysin-like protein
MLIFLTILIIFVIGFLVYVEAIQLPYTDLSPYELQRRGKEGDIQASLRAKRHRVAIDIWSLKRVVITLLITIMTVLSIIAYGWIIGFIVATVFGFEYATIARLKFIQKSSSRRYLKMEPVIFRMIIKHTLFFKMIRSSVQDFSTRLGSRQELEYLIDTSEGVLTQDEKKLIVNGLSFGDRKVKEIMIRRPDIDTIKSSEFLGPLTLDDLHKLGHSRLPVIDKDIDHIIGVLHLEGLLALDVKRSVTAEKAMDPQVIFIRQDHSLKQALALFIRHRNHLLIVTNEYKATMGILSLQDVVEALFGGKLDSETDDNV